MQLIPTQSITEDIQIKMSAQIETPPNENISEVKDINQGFKINETTILALEKSLSSELSSSDISNEIVLMKEKSRDNITESNGDKYYCTPEYNLVANTNSMVSQNITNGASCAQDTQGSECNTQNLEITYEDNKPSENKTIDSEHYIQNNSKTPKYFTKSDVKSDLTGSDKLSLEYNDNSIISLDKSKDISTNIDTNSVSYLEKVIIPDIPVKKEELKPLPASKDIIGADPEKLKDESKYTEMTSTDAGKFSDDVEMGEEIVKLDPEKLKDGSNHTELTSTDAGKYSDDIEMGEEILKVSENPLNVVTIKELNATVNQNCLDSKDFSMDEIDSNDKEQPTENNTLIKMDTEILPANQTDEDIRLIESEDAKYTKKNKEESLSIQTDENLISLESKETKHIDLGNKQLFSAQTKENHSLLETVDPEPLEEGKISLPPNISENEISLHSDTQELKKTEKEVLPPFQTDKNTLLAKSEATNSIDMTDEIQVQQTSGSEQFTAKDETKETLTKFSESMATTIATDNSEILKDSSEKTFINMLETDISLVSEFAAKTEFVVTDKTEKLKEHTSETNLNNSQDIVTSAVSECSISVATNNTKKLEGHISEINLNSIQETGTFIVHSTSICDEDQVKENNRKITVKENQDNDSMEIDDIEIKDVKNENLKGVSKNEDSKSDEVLSKVTSLEGIKSEITSKTVAEQKVAEDFVEKNESILVSKVVKNIPTDDFNLDTNVITSKIDGAHKVTEDLVEKYVEKSEVLENTVAENILPKSLNDDTNSSTIVENKNSDSIEKEIKDLTKEDQEKIEIIDEDDVKIVDLDDDITKIQQKKNSHEKQEPQTLPVVCTLSNTLDILSDDEEEASNLAGNIPQQNPEEKQCINLDDDDDIMLIEEDANIKDKSEVSCNKGDTELKQSHKVDVVASDKQATIVTDLVPNIDEEAKKNDSSTDNICSMELDAVPETEIKSEVDINMSEKPLLPQNFLKTAKKNLANMTRHELEDFCILRIVESIVDRSNLSDIKTKMKTMAQNLEDYKKRALMMTKQNRDLQVVLKSVQEEQKKRLNTPIIPLKITRSVGMQVLMNDKLDPRRKAPIPNPVQVTPTAGTSGRLIRGTPNVKQIKPPASPVNIPVPRKVPVNNSPSKPVTNTPINSVGNKSASPNPIGVRNPSPIQKAPEKRTHSRMQATSVTVDLTDDEPPAKINNKTTPTQPVRVVPPQNLLAPQRQFPPITNNSRKVYIPISGPGAPQIRPGQTYVMKNMSSNPVPKSTQRMPILRPQQQNPRPKQPANRHPAPLPESMKQYTPSTWKALPPAPDLKLSKVENGIVISWKIDGYPEGDYETIASYQLYAYQETTAPPCTALWKKIGDVKALPLPMACTLTQFMAGFKYYFAVRAVDIKCRLGPFSLPGSILLLNKV